MSRRTRAYENCMYVISSNHGGYAAQLSGDVFADSPGLNFRSGGTEKSRPCTVPTADPRSSTSTARSRPRLRTPARRWLSVPSICGPCGRSAWRYATTSLVQSRTEIYAREYTRHKATGINRWLETPIAHKSEARQSTEAVIARYLRDGVYTPPEGYQPASRSEEQNSALT